ncbi:MAG: YfbU family protein [Oscillospiraceae bacterium]|nr:YfbU family protein [Oscillospiraceae bacterium]
MKLTQVERQILYNQYDILSVLCPVDKELFELNKTILLNGYVREYDGLMELHDEVSTDICDFVYDVLTMYRILYSSYHKLEDKSNISDEDVIFQGFDGNDETQYYAFASFLLKDKKLYSEFKNVEVNSHASRVGIYKSMLDIYTPIYDKMNKDRRYGSSLTEEEIIKIVDS